MMLPGTHSSYDSYFSECVGYLKDYRWIYDFAVTDVLVEGVFSRMPDGWLSTLTQLTYEELNGILFGFKKDSWPESLVTFCQRSMALHLVLENGPAGVDPSQLPRELRLNLSPKKQHEVCRLAPLVHQECQALGITRVLDIGAGLGYLGRLLHHQYGYQVLGIDVDGQKVDAASRRQLSCCPSDTSVTYTSSEITPGSEQFIRNSIHATLARPAADCMCGEQRDVAAPGAFVVCAVGLHACGDLAPSMLDLFAKLPELRGLVLVPCCYHKASLDGAAGCEVSGKGFPLSACLRALVREMGLAERGLLLRLAAQETAARWRNLSEEDHQKHGFNVLSRAVLQLYAHQANLSLVKKRRRGVRRSKLKTTRFVDFLDDALARYELVGAGVLDRAEVRAGLQRLWMVHREQCRAVEVLTVLQVMMQAPAEHLVTLDRLAYLQEVTGGTEASIVRAMDDNVSPRCLALVARKPP